MPNYLSLPVAEGNLASACRAGWHAAGWYLVPYYAVELIAAIAALGLAVAS